MSFLRFLFETPEERLRRDIDELRITQFRNAIRGDGKASEQWVEEIADEVKELAATVRVLLRMMHEANVLDMEKVREAVTEELRPKPRPQAAAAPPRPQAPAIEVACIRCSTRAMSSEMVDVGADWMCRPCARNP